MYAFCCRSPEQTGRIHVTIDTRSDIYCLGGTLYYLLAKQPPFLDNTHAGLIQSHLSTNAPLLSENNSTIPTCIDTILQKMLAKSKKKRFQSISTVEKEFQHALEFYSHRNDEGNLEKEFILTEANISDIFELPSKLYGRERYLEHLRNLLDNCKLNNTSHLLFFAGEPGVGKTSIYSEFCDTTKSDAIFVQGKYDQFNNSIPYSAILTCMNEIIGHFVGSQIPVKEQLMEALDGKGRTLIEVLPDIKMLIGDDHPVLPQVGPDEILERFITAMITFFKVIIDKLSQSTIIVMMIDDIQWADIPSFILLERLIKSNLRIMIIGIYRDNEIGPDHPIHPMTNSIEFAQREGDLLIHMETIKINPLTSTELAQLIQGTIFQSGEHVNQLAELIQSRTNGNPFFARQLLLNLYLDECIRFNYDKYSWDFDIQQIKQVEVSDNVVNMMINRLRECSEDIKQTLVVASCIGNYFSFNDLMDGTGLNSTQLRLRLRQCVSDGWLLELSDVSFKFSHDKLQESAYKLMDNDTRINIHYQLGNSILNNQQEDYNNEDDTSGDKKHYLSISYSYLKSIPVDDSEKIIIEQTLQENATSEELKEDVEIKNENESNVSKELKSNEDTPTLDSSNAESKEETEVRSESKEEDSDSKEKTNENADREAKKTVNSTTSEELKGVGVEIINENVDKESTPSEDTPTLDSPNVESKEETDSNTNAAKVLSSENHPQEELTTNVCSTTVELQGVESDISINKTESNKDSIPNDQHSVDTTLEEATTTTENQTNVKEENKSTCDIKVDEELPSTGDTKEEQQIERGEKIKFSQVRVTEVVYVVKEKIFDIILHLNQALQLIIGRNDDKEKMRLVALNLAALQIALASSASAKAVELAEINSRLVKGFDEEWDADEYELLYSVYLHHGEALRVARKHDPADLVLAQLMNKTQKREHQYEVMHNRLNIYNAQTRYNEAYDMLMEFLDKSTDLLYGLNHRGTVEEIYAWIGVQRPQITELIYPFLENWRDIGPNTNLVQVNFLRCILESIAIFYLSIKANKILFMAMLLIGGRIQLTGGLCEVHTCLLGPLSFTHHILTGNAELSYRLADTAREIAKPYNIERWTCISTYFFAFNCHAKKNLYEHHDLYERSLHIAIRCGEHCWGSLSAGFACMITVEVGMQIDYARKVLNHMMAYCESLKSDKIILMLQFSHNVLSLLAGDIHSFNSNELQNIDENEMNEIPMIRYWYWACKSLCEYFLNQLDAAYSSIEKSGEYHSDIIGCSTDFTHHYRRAIILAKLLENEKTLMDQQNQNQSNKGDDDDDTDNSTNQFSDRYNILFKEFVKSRKHLKDLNKKFTVYVLPQWYTVEAEWMILNEYDSSEIMKMYQKSMDLGHDHKSNLVAAIAATRFAHFTNKLQINDRIIALQASDAIRLWSKLGYKFIQIQLTEQYQNYITGFDFSHNSSNSSNSKGSSSNNTANSSKNQSLVNTTNILDTVDALSFSLASQVSSYDNEMDIPNLFSNMLSIILTNAGASRCCLIVKESASTFGSSSIKIHPKEDSNNNSNSSSSSSSSFIFEAELSNQSINNEYQIIRKPLHDCNNDMCINLIHRVLRSRNFLQIPNAKVHPNFKNEDYIKKHSISSILCMPIINQLNLEGCLYLENQQTTGVFTDQRCQLLRTIIQVSIENARLFTSLNNSYARFLPRPFLEQLGKLKVTDVEQGDAVERKMSVMFSDIRNFTNITEKMSAKQSFQFVNNLFQSLTPQIEKRTGFIDKYIGDAIMALFPHQVSTALHAAVGMTKSLQRFNLTYNGDAPISIGIGIHFGSLMLGTIGTKQRLNATVISDTVNIASRLEALTKAFGCPILVSQDVITEFENEYDSTGVKQYLLSQQSSSSNPTTDNYTNNNNNHDNSSNNLSPSSGKIVPPISKKLNRKSMEDIVPPPSHRSKLSANIRTRSVDIQHDDDSGVTGKNPLSRVNSNAPVEGIFSASVHTGSALPPRSPQISISPASEQLTGDSHFVQSTRRYFESIQYMKVGSFLLKGKDVPYDLYEVYQLSKDKNIAATQIAERNAFSAGLDIFYTGDFVKTQQYFADMLTTFPHHLLASLYEQVCGIYATRPAPKFLAIKLDKDGGFV